MSIEAFGCISPCPLLPAPVSSHEMKPSCPLNYNGVYSRRIFPSSCITTNGKLRLGGRRFHRVPCTRCRARRRVRYEEEEDGKAEYGHNVDVAMLELYSQGAKDEALLVRAMVDDEEHEAQILIFKGFSSSLSYETSADPTRSILPARAVIKSIDRIKGPFDPSNIQYIEKDLDWETFKTRLQPN